MSQEFLPLCDVLFNIISLASYFCDVVFDLIAVYTLYERGQLAWFGLALACVAASLLASQALSLRWHLRTRRSASSSSSPPPPWDLCAVLAVHVLQAGVVWRYSRLFVPVDLRYVKGAVRDLCLLRLVHAFGEAVPMLLIQLHLMWGVRSASELTQLTLVSAVLSLFSVCWALASFNKHVRRSHLHRLVLTWLGVIYQFLWRLGTVTSRVVALTLYASRYHLWVLLVIGLHWLSMFLWLMSPRNVFDGERVSRRRKCALSLLISYVYVFCYVNLQEVNARHKMAAFYVTMFLENTLLMTVWLGQRAEPPAADYPWVRHVGVAAVWGGFAFGIVFMLLYYRYFHVRRLHHHRPAADDQPVPPDKGPCTSCQLGTCAEHSDRATVTSYLSASDKAPSWGPPPAHGNGVAYVPGVFNCRLNPAFKRKKKKPTTFVPVPVGPAPPPHQPNGRHPVDANGKVPFWKRPLSRADAPRVDIQQKLEAKKRQQLQELRVIEEEIKQGKLERPHPTDMTEQGTLRQPIPKAKKRPWALAPKYRAGTPEVLLAPHYLEHARVYYDYGEEKWRFAPREKALPPEAPSRDDERADALFKSYRIPSDLDSQVSLPRSYTLPREFRYHRKPKARRVIRSEHFIASTNSSDGDVDSGDDELHASDSPKVSSYRGQPQPATGTMAASRSRPPSGYNLHETKL